MRPNSRARGYTTQWDREALRYKKQHPLCVMCKKAGKVTLATCVDHIIPHKGNKGLFWALSNWQSLCTPCHSSKKQVEERTGFSREIDADGYPTAFNHPANRRVKWPYSIPSNVRHSAIPVTLVAGPPGAGKSTYVQAHKGQHDLVIDFDECRKAAGGTKWDRDPHINRKAFAIRDALICGLCTATEPRAWLICMAPTAAERRTWLSALGPHAAWHTLSVDAATCRDRIALDPDRAPMLKAMFEAVDQWWRDYTPD